GPSIGSSDATTPSRRVSSNAPSRPGRATGPSSATSVVERRRHGRGRAVETGAPDDVVAACASLGPQLSFFQGQDATVPEERPAGYPCLGDAGGAHRPDQGLQRVVVGRPLVVVEVEEDEIGALPRFERADLVIPTERPRAVDRRHTQRLARADLVLVQPRILE